MSEQALAWFAALDPKVLTHAEFRVLNRLAWHHNDEENCAWPSYKYLIAKTGISRGGLSKCMDRLEEKGLIQRVQRENESTLYYLNFEFAQETPVHSVNPSRSLSEPKGVRSVDHNKYPSKQDILNRGDLFDAEQDQPASKPKAKRACQLPEGWVPNSKNVEDAINLGLTHEEIDHEADQFRDYAAANGRTQKDWDAAWRTWCRNSRKFSAGRRVANPSGAKGYGQGGGLAAAYARRHGGS